MARFDVYRNSGPHTDAVPYLLDVQSDLLYGLETRVAVPHCALLFDPKSRHASMERESCGSGFQPRLALGRA